MRPALAAAVVSVAIAITGGDAVAHSEQGLLAVEAIAATTLAYESEGRYRATLTIPSDGVWTVIASSEAPVATGSDDVAVITPATTTRGKLIPLGPR